MFKVYFTSRDAYPFIWCIETEDGKEKLNVKEIAATNKTFRSVCDVSADNDKDPIAWFEIEASEVIVMEDIAYFK